MDETEQALLAAITTLAERAGKANSTQHAQELGQAAACLAEAFAWLRSPAQPH
jgi:Mn-dependent DtxR family transcriptional regulator